jgi:hypothetical protein
MATALVVSGFAGVKTAAPVCPVEGRSAVCDELKLELAAAALETTPVPWLFEAAAVVGPDPDRLLMTSKPMIVAVIP